MTGKPRDQHLPEGSPDLPAGGSVGGHDPNTRTVPGHEGETAFQAGGGVLGRLRTAKSGSRTESARRDEESRAPATDAGYQPTDSSRGEHARGPAGTSMV